jgi:hypothetical protein
MDDASFLLLFFVDIDDDSLLPAAVRVMGGDIVSESERRQKK